MPAVLWLTSIYMCVGWVLCGPPWLPSSSPASSLCLTAGDALHLTSYHPTAPTHTRGASDAATHVVSISAGQATLSLPSPSSASAVHAARTLGDMDVHARATSTALIAHTRARAKGRLRSAPTLFVHLLLSSSHITLSMCTLPMSVTCHWSTYMHTDMDMNMVSRHMAHAHVQHGHVVLSDRPLRHTLAPVLHTMGMDMHVCM